MLEVADPGPLTSVQTPFGRPGWQHLGIPVGGAADPWSARLANRLVGNPDEAPMLEATLAGPTLRFDSATLVAVTGARWSAMLDGLPLPHHQSRGVRAGSVLRVGTGPGARAYIGVAGLGVEPLLGSPATDLRSGFGGHEGRSLRAGDRLTVAAHEARPARWIGASLFAGPVRIVPGPHSSPPMQALLAGEWQVTDAVDRAGVRLDRRGATPEVEAAEVSSMGLPLGAIQIPPDGRPIVMLADRPVTGGYPVPACVIRADIGRMAQLRPGDEVSLVFASGTMAITALRRAEAALDAIEPISLTADDETGWAGSLD